MGTEKKENLEEMFDRLDQVIGTLEGEDVSLEEAFGLYDQGMKLIRRSWKHHSRAWGILLPTRICFLPGFTWDLILV